MGDLETLYDPSVRIRKGILHENGNGFRVRFSVKLVILYDCLSICTQTQGELGHNPIEFISIMTLYYIYCIGMQ